MRSLYLTVAFSLLFINGAYSQLVRVTGKVTDLNNLPLFQVVIQEQGKLPSALTDSEGNYQVDVRKGTLLVFSKVGYESIEIQVAEEGVRDLSMNEDMLLNRTVLDVGYYSLHREKSADAVGYSSESNFNQGNIYDPAMLLQGRIAGVSVNNRGGDPNKESIIRIRGLTTLDPKAQPLIVIDGVPMASFVNLDPQDIASVTVLKDGASASIYGIRGSGGVILITTKNASAQRGLSVSLSAQGSFASLSKEIPVLTSDQYIQVGGNDLGSSTNWQREVTRVGGSQEYHLALSGATDKSSFRVSTHLRSVNGILLHSGFDQANTRINITHQALNKRLRFNVNASFANRNINYSFPDAFKYATRFNPTAPIRFLNGDFYQAILFSNYNPIALLELNTSEGKKQATTLSGKIDGDVLKNLTATLHVAYQQTNDYKGQYFAKESFFMGLGSNGLANKNQDEASFTYAESYLTYKFIRENVKINMVGGYAYQEDRLSSYGATVSNFETDAAGYKVLSYSYDELLDQPGLTQIFNRSNPDNRTIAGFIRSHWQIGSGINLFGGLRYEGSSKLGENTQSGLFKSLGTNVDVLSYLKRSNLKFFNLRLNYGTTGSVPVESGLAQDRFQTSVITGIETQVHSGNPNLKWEQKRESNVGVDIGWRNLSASIDGYKRKTTDIIGGPTFEGQYVNMIDLASRGLEFTLGYKVGRERGLQWYPMVMLNTNRVVVDRYPVKQELNGVGQFCGCGTEFIRTAVGEKIGQMWSTVFSGTVDASGYQIMKDINGNGILETNGLSVFAENTDFTDVGNAFPAWELGWNNRFVFKNFQLGVFFRGAFGHSIINSARLAFEPENSGALSNFNWIRTTKAVPGLIWPAYSSLYVERADFLMLDNLTLEYTIPLKFVRSESLIKIYGTAQRLFTITNYTGVDPEPILIDGSTEVLAPGIDRLENYFPARTFTIGLLVKI